MNEWALLVIGLIVGAAAAWLWAQSKIKVAESTATVVGTQLGLAQADLEAKDRQVNDLQQQVRTESEHKVVAQTELNQVRASLEEQKKLLEDAKKNLTDTFNALASEALMGNNQAFLALAKSTFETLQAEAKGDLDTRQKAIDGLVQPLKESLGRYEKQILEMERARQTAYGGLEEQLKGLSRVTANLDIALRTPQVRGRWGEMTLRRVAELAGMSAHCDFLEQETFLNDGERLRPDMIVYLPGDRRIAVDAKVPLQAFLDAVSAATEEDRKLNFSRHSKLVRSHMEQLGRRSYWEQLNPAPEMVILFLPGESFFSAALEQDRTLIEDGMENRVILATPTTLIALLLAVAHGWRQQSVEQNAQAISDLGKELYDRIRTFTEHFTEIGAALSKATESYNRATGSLERRVLISARRFKELGATAGEEINAVEPVDQTPRLLEVPERGDAP